jgi:hypothetical protein|tara:strand:+ start:227 stop:421 length:195 start_codon:yes stop_codon:yes gene_type:complete
LVGYRTISKTYRYQDEELFTRTERERISTHVVHKKNKGGNIILDVGANNLPIGEYWKITNTFIS